MKVKSGHKVWTRESFLFHEPSRGFYTIPAYTQCYLCMDLTSEERSYIASLTRRNPDAGGFIRVKLGGKRRTVPKLKLLGEKAYNERIEKRREKTKRRRVQALREKLKRRLGKG